MECPICCEKFDLKTRKACECEKCNNKICMICIKKYMIMRLDDPHCLICKKTWDYFFLTKTLPRNFINNELKTARRELLFKREQSYFAETMPFIANQIKIEKLNKEFNEINDLIKNLEDRKRDIYRQIVNIENSDSKECKKNKNIQKCVSINCKGYIDIKGYCEICEENTCLVCNTSKKEDHHCNDDDRETWILIKNTSKPCPSCFTRIQRTEGCSQMWCPGCHKAFDWNTGKIVEGPIHNPHYYEYTQRLGINLNENRGCNEAQVWDYFSFRHLRLDFNKLMEFRNIHQKLNHIIHNDLPNNRRKLDSDNIDIRISFLRNKINEEDFKKILIKREIKHLKLRKIVEFQEMINLAIVPLLEQLIDKKIHINDWINSVINLNDIINESIDNLNTSLKSNISKIYFT